MLVQEEFFLYFFLNIFKSYQEVKKVYLNRLKKVYQDKTKKFSKFLVLRYDPVPS